MSEANAAVSPAIGSKWLPRPAVPTRTDAILAAIRKELDEYRVLVDKSGNLGEVTVSVKLHVGSTEVRRVEVSCQKIMRRLGGRDGSAG